MFIKGTFVVNGAVDDRVETPNSKEIRAALGHLKALENLYLDTIKDSTLSPRTPL